MLFEHLSRFPLIDLGGFDSYILIYIGIDEKGQCCNLQTQTDY